MPNRIKVQLSSHIFRKNKMPQIRASQDSLFLWIHRLLDLMIPAVVIIQLALMNSPKVHDRYIIAGLLAGLAITSLAQMNGTYSEWRGRSLFASFRKVLSSWILSWLLVVSLAFVLKMSESFSREVWLLWLGITPVILMLYRIVIRTSLSLLRKRGIGRRNILILGAGHVGAQLANNFDQHAWMGFNVVGFMDDNPSKHSTSHANHPVLADINETLEYAAKMDVSEVFICLPKNAEQRVKDIFNILSDSSLIVKYVPDLFSFNLMHSHIEVYQGIPVIGVYDTPLSSRSNKLIKRLEDIVLATVALVIFSPIMIITAIAVKLSSPGPVLFKQVRHGLSGKEIKVYKFRSMTTQDNGDVVQQATKGDARITKVGQLIRKTSLDELPQLLNVLKGDMSMVGPRPHARAHNEEYRKQIPSYMLRHLAKPGITGYAQVLGYRGETDTLEKMQKRVDADLFYVSNWTIWFDIKILVQTVFVGFINKNAY